MKRITDSAIFQKTLLNKSIITNLKNIVIERDKVDLNKLEEPINIINKRINFPTKGAIKINLKKENIILISNPIINLPKYLSSIGKIYNNRLVSIVDISKYTVLSKDGKYYDIYPKTLYSLMQNGLITLELFNNWNKYTNNIEIIKNSAIAYSRLMGKIMDKILAINIDPYRSDVVNFFLAKFFLVNVCDKADNDTINNIAYNACFNESSLKIVLMQEENFKDNAYSTIMNFFDNLKSIKGLNELSFRTFLENWVRMYGDSTLLAMDYLPSFLSMTYGSIISGNIAKDAIIETIAGKYIAKSYTEFCRLLK